MSRNIVTFDHVIGEKIEILALEMPGIVEAMSLSQGRDREYRVSYWSDNKRHSEWVRSDEIRDSVARPRQNPLS